MKILRFLLAIFLTLPAFAQTPVSTGVGLTSFTPAFEVGGTELIFGWQPGSGGTGVNACVGGWCPVTFTPNLLKTFFGDVTVSGTPTTGHCVEWLTPTSIEDAGSACGSGGGSGTVTLVSVVSANGLSGTISNPTTTPAITLVPTFSGFAFSNGFGFSAATAGNFAGVNVPTFGGTITSGHCVQWTSATVQGDSGSTCGSGGSNAFSALTSSTNVSATMLVGTGASIAPTGSGTIVATSVSGITTITQTIASGTSTLGTSAISSGTCASVVTTSASGVLTTDTITWTFNADPTATVGYQPSSNGMLTIINYPTVNNVSFKVCNNTASSISPGAVALNWRVVR